jgi:exopolysaccharide biosynthesis WecB/TagA/CpsF family protein
MDNPVVVKLQDPLAHVLKNLDELASVLTAARACRVQTVNLHHLQLAAGNAGFKRALEDADYLTADGWPIVLLANSLGMRVEKVAGSAFLRRLLQDRSFAPGLLRIGLIGATEEAGDRFERSLLSAGRSLVYREHGLAEDWTIPTLLDGINDVGRMDLLLIAVTPPTGEIIAADLVRAGMDRPVIAVGGSIDMAVGITRFAPEWVVRARLEWFFRLLQQPGRLLGRYLVEGPKGMTTCLSAILKHKRAGKSNLSPRGAERTRQVSIKVLQVGLIGDYPGGMAQVLNRYMRWTFEGFQLIPVCTTRWRRDPLSPMLYVRALLAILIARATSIMRDKGRVTIAAFHVSEGGSFVREGSLAMLASKLGFRTIIHLHGARFTEFAKRRSGLVSSVIGNANAVAVLTNEHLEIVRNLRSSTEGVYLIPNGVDETPAPTPAGKLKRVIFAGELSPRKGLDVLTAAWEEVADRHPDWTLLIAGPDTSGLLRQMRQLKRARYLGVASNAEIAGLMREARVAVLPSRNEALPMFLLESMSYGCIPVSTTVGQIPELLAGVGVLVPPGDVTALVEALSNLLGREDEHDRLSAAAWQRIQSSYSSTRTIDALCVMWKELAQTNRGKVSPAQAANCRAGR